MPVLGTTLLVVLSAGVAAADDGQASSLLLVSGNINGQTVSPSNRQVLVSPGATITGSYTVQINSAWPSFCAMAIGVTATWGSHATSYIDLGNFPTPVSGLSSTIPLNLTAPTTPGSYYIITAFSAEFTAGQVISSTNWSVGSLVWDNGDDVAGWSTSAINSANFSGNAHVNNLNGSPPAEQLTYIPATAIEIIVANPATPLAASPSSQLLALTGSASFTIPVEWGVPYGGNPNGFNTSVTISVPCGTGIALSFVGSSNSSGNTGCYELGSVASITLQPPATQAVLMVTAELTAPVGQNINLSVCGVSPPPNNASSYCVGPTIKVKKIIGIGNTVAFTALNLASIALDCNQCFSIQQNSYVYRSTSANGCYPSYWIQNIVIVSNGVPNGVTQGWLAKPIFEILRVKPSGAPGCLIDANFAGLNTSCVNQAIVAADLVTYLDDPNGWVPISPSTGFLPIGLQSTLVADGSGNDVVSFASSVGGAAFPTLTSDLKLSPGAFISAGQSQSLNVSDEPELALVSMKDGVVTFSSLTAGTLSSQTQLAGEVWVSAQQAPFLGSLHLDHGAVLRDFVEC